MMHTNLSYRKYNGLKEILAIPLLLICPFVSFLLTLKNPLGKYNKFLFLIYFGLTGFIRKLLDTGDANSWTNVILSFVTYGKKSFIYFGDEFLFNPGYFSFLYMLSYFRYTAIIWSVIFVLTGIILLYIFRLQFPDTKCSSCRIYSSKVLCLFVFYISFIPFNSFGVKFWVALNIFLIGFYLYINKGKKRGLLILISSLLFHFAFSYMILLFVFHYFIERELYKKPHYLLLLICVSMPISYYILTYISSDYIEYKFEAYASGSLVEQRAMWIQFDRFLTASFSYIALIVLFVKRKYIPTQSSKSLLLFLFILSIGLIPLMSTLDGLDRYSRVFSYMMLIFLLKLFIEKMRHINSLFYLSIPVFSYHMLVNFFMRKGELDIGIFFRDISYFISGNLMSTVINS